jgi:uncharacterized membrane protein
MVTLALAGLAVSGSAAYVHHRLIVDPSYISPCDINATFNCSQVYMSRFGTVAGIPVAYPGVVWFALVGLIAALRRPRPDDATGSYVFVLSTLALAGVFYLAYASWFVLKAWCIFCLGTYACVIGLFLVSGAAAAVPVRQLPARLVRDLRESRRSPRLLIGVVLFLLLSVAMLVVLPRQTVAGASSHVPVLSPAGATTTPAAPPSPSTEPSNPDDVLLAWLAKQPRVNVGIPANGAKVVIVKFLDWECPTCKYTHELYKPLLDEYARTRPADVKYVEKDFPLHTKCNSHVSVDVHHGPCEAAAAVRLAADHGKRSEMVDWILAHQDAFGPAIAAEASTLLGVTQFDLQYSIKLPQIQRDISDGAALGITGTPTYFINGVRLPPQTLAVRYFKLLIDSELNKGK